MNKNLSILVVDDEQGIRDIFRQYLEASNGYSVLTAKDGVEALEIIKNKEIDCCFTDISMPGMDGVELARRLHLHDSTVPVVIMTGYPSMDNAIETLKNGVVDFLTKPIELGQVSLTIDRVMKERSLFVENMLLREEAKKTEKLLEVNQELGLKIGELEKINLILQELNRATTSKELFNVLVDLSGKVTPCDEAHFCIPSQGDEYHALIASFCRDKREPEENRGFVEDDLITKAASEGVPFLLNKNNGSGNFMAIPLRIKSKVFGILLSVIRDGRRAFSEKDLYFQNFLAEKASFLIENLALYENIYENIFSTLYAFVGLIEARDPYTKQHSSRVSSYAMSMARAAGCSQEEIDKLNVAGNLHDIGKIGVPDRILLKPDRLTDEEYEFIKKHPVIGGNIIGHFGMWRDEQIIIRHHHERWDGKGYPDHLKGEGIPFLSRLLSVADVYDALTSDRSYRKRISDAIAINMIRENAGGQFDPELVKVFLRLYDN